MFITYNKKDYDAIKRQHNIIALIGNGFDIATLRQFGGGKMKGKSTSYLDFYEYISYYKLCSDGNCLYKKMTDDRYAGKENWSDFENSIDELLGTVAVSTLEMDLAELQSGFTRFLNDIVTSDILINVNRSSQEQQLAKNSLSKFLGDLGPESAEIRFPKTIWHYHLFNFLFVNFNYTMLLDNYIFLDKEQFDPHQYRTVDTNFKFYTNPKKTLNASDTNYSSYILTDVIHPHGIQYVPRSMIFGTERESYNRSKPEKRMVKSYWAQNDVKYRRYFEGAELFIIYGMSLSKTDGWWMDKIFESLLAGKAELILYFYGGGADSNEIKSKYLEACIRHRNCSDEERDKVFRNIYVVRLRDNKNYFLGYDY